MDDWNEHCRTLDVLEKLWNLSHYEFEREFINYFVYELGIPDGKNHNRHDMPSYPWDKY